MKKYTEPKLHIYQFVKEYIEKNKKSPSMCEIRDAIGLKSHSLVIYYINQLVKEGLIKRPNKHKYRNLQIVNMPTIKVSGKVEVPPYLNIAEDYSPIEIIVPVKKPTLFQGLKNLFKR